jgi:hypothetical protein
MKNRIYKFRADDTKGIEIEKAAEARGVSVSEFIRQAVDNELKGRKCDTKAIKSSKVCDTRTPKQDKVVTQKESDSAFERFKRFKPLPDSRVINPIRTIL